MELAPTRQATRLEGPTALEAVVEHARNTASDDHDYPEVILPDTWLEEDGNWRFDGAWGKLSRHALAQLCARLPLPAGGAPPAGYLARCPDHLAAANLNHWLARCRQHEQPVLVRTRQNGGTDPGVRAVLSHRYRAVDHLPLLEALERLLPEHRLSLGGWSLDDEQLTLRIVANADHPASLQDPLRVGLHVSNSEVGLGCVSLTALVTRLVCSNGLVVKVADLGGLHRRHVGRAGENLQETVHVALPRVLEEADEAARRFARLRHQPAPQPLEPFLERTAREAELPDEHFPRLAPLLEGETLYDVVNAFTRLAQGFPVAERVRLETAMSRFLRDGANWN